MTRDPPDITGLLNRFINVPENLQDTLSHTDRGLSLGTAAALGIAALVIVVALVFLGAAAFGGNGGPVDAGNETTTVPPTSTHNPTTTQNPTTIDATKSTPTQTPGRNLERFTGRFVTRLEAENDALEVIDVAVRNNTVYVTTNGPAQGGPAVATAGDMANAFTDAMTPVWEDESSELGIDHAVVQLYNETDYHWFTYRIEESWAYRYHTGDIDISKITSMILGTDHKIGNTGDFLDTTRFRQYVSGLDGVEVRSLEQYGSTYFMALEMDDYAGEDYNQTIFEISEALHQDRNTMGKVVYLHYVVYAENGTAVTSNRWNTGLAYHWREGDITESNYRASLVWNNYDATQIPGGIGSMLTRIQPFPAEGPGE
ncbi:MAG: hypothetical protein V5A24_04145 [Haloarculaceae archaeon]